MGFRVKAVKRLKGPQFKIQYEWFSKQSGRQSRDIPKDEWTKHGFRFDMSLDQAKNHVKIVNAQEKLSREERRRQGAKAVYEKTRLLQQAFFPLEHVTEFESLKLGVSLKAQSYWNKAREIITELALPCQDWEPKKELFYKAFFEREMSPAYVQKVLPLINRWGDFYAYKCNKPFRRIPSPPREWAKNLMKAHKRRERGKGNKKSQGLRPGVLYENKGRFKEEEYRWLYLSVWFGLRPIEVDLLNQSSGKFTWKIREVSKEKRLYVFQTKLEGDEDHEWKFIPCRQKQQIEGLKLIGKPLKRPSQIKMKKTFGGEITLYGGRQGFVKLMKFYKAPYEDIAKWLGHVEIERTYKDYTRKLEEDYNESDVYGNSED